MKMIDIVKIFEEYVQKFNDKAVITLKKNIEVCSIKAYKKYSYSLYFTHRVTRQGFELVNIDSTARVTNEKEEEEIIKDLDKKLCMWIFDWLRKTNLIDGNE